MRSEAQAVAWRSYWPVALLAVTFLTVVGLFGTYLNGRQQVASDRAEKQRRAICAILANIPGHIPAEIARARVVFARHPGECLPIVRPTPKPTPAPTVTVTPLPGVSTVVVKPGPTVTRTRQSTPQPSATPTKQPSPSPSPSRTCVPFTGICTH